MLYFRYDADLLKRFPAIRGGVILARRLHSGPTPPALADAFRAEQQSTLARLGATPLSEVPSLAAWRRAFSAFGVKPTQYRSAAEALLRRLTKQGDLPSVNLLVDLGNLVSIRYALPVAVLDLAHIQGAITVRLAAGDERFLTLDSDDVDTPAPGEVIFIDEAGTVCARRWCWRQSDESAARDSTATALITVEGHHAAAAQDIQAALRDLQTLLGDYIPGALLHTALLSPESPAFALE